MSAAARAGPEPLPPLVKKLGWVSFFTDAASEMLYPLIPIFLTVTLGAPLIAVGLIEGLADGVATGLKAFSGTIADRIRKPKILVFAGYLLSAISKPLLAAASGWGVVAALRVADRLGKAVRGAPRDLMISQAVGSAHRGRAFGFHRMMDTAGAVVGPLVAIAALAVAGEGELRTIFLLALIPGLLAVALLFRLPETAPPRQERWVPQALPWRGRFGWFVVASVIFGIGNSSDAFLLLRAKDVGLSSVEVILAYAFFNLVYAAVSLPAGIRSDTGSRLRIIAAGWIVFAIVYLGFGLISSGAAVWPLMAVYGAYMALTDGVGRALVVDLVPETVRGKALGVTQAISGACFLGAGVLAGTLWDRVSPSAPFIWGAVTATAGAVVLGFIARLPALNADAVGPAVVEDTE